MLITTFLRPLLSLIKCRLSFMIEMGLFQQHLKKEWRIEMGVHPVLFLVRKGMGLFQKMQLNGGSFLDFRFSASYLRCIAAKYSFFFFAAKLTRLSSFVRFYLKAMTPFYDHIFSLIHYFT